MKQKLDNIRVIFIVSRGRSGSTLLQSIIDAHPNICAPIESKFVLHLKTKYQDISNWNNKIVSSFIKDIYTNRKFRLFWNVTPQELETLFKKYHISNFADACKVIYLSHQSMFPKEEIKLIVDKNPLHSIFISQILEVFPGANFIHLIRDPRASSYSHIKALLQTSVSPLAADWSLLNMRIELAKMKFSHLFYTIKYEDLTRIPEEKLIQLFSFINISFNPNLLNANKTIKQKIQANRYLSLPHHTNIAQPIYTKMIDLWKEKLTKKEIEIINLICEPQLIKYKYSYSKPSYSLKNKVMIKLSKKRALFTEWMLQLMFNMPFIFRVLLFRLVSALRDKRYKN